MKEIMTSEDPDNWAMPQWHEDYGDPVPELEHLRSLGRMLIAEAGFSTCLKMPEPGLMFLAVRTPSGHSFEIFSLTKGDCVSDRKFALFSADVGEGEEIYSADVRQLIEYMRCL